MVRLIAISLLFLAAALAFGSESASAAHGSVSIQPSSSGIPYKGMEEVDVVLDPPAEGVSVFIIRMAYDPAVVQFVDCVAWDWEAVPRSFPRVGAAGCAATDSNRDGVDDTAVVFGAYVENRSGTPGGFETQQIVGSITFESLGKKGDVTPLLLSAESGDILGPDATVLNPELQDGSICITGKHGGTPNALRKCYGK